ncbi:MAG TPA: sugar-binding domain-containing protein [Polyangiaceae bacterium]
MKPTYIFAIAVSALWACSSSHGTGDTNNGQGGSAIPGVGGTGSSSATGIGGRSSSGNAPSTAAGTGVNATASGGAQETGSGPATTSGLGGNTGGKSASGGATSWGGVTNATGGKTAGSSLGGASITGGTGSGVGGSTSNVGGASVGGTGVGAAGTGGSSIGGGSNASVRMIQNFNQSWKFKRADVTGAEASAFDDSAWGNVGLPHSFSLPYFMSPKFYVGYGWYRKHFAVPASWSGKSVFLEFQAAFDQAQIYVNGKQVGEHIGGYNGFSINVSSAITAGDNVVAVRLNNNWNAQLPPITGDHTFQGGLYRDAFVVVTDPLHIAWYGTWVTTPTLATNAGASSTVSIKTEVRNDRTAAVSATLKTDIVDDSGKIVATISSQQQIAAGAAVTFDQTTPAVTNPALWHPDHPTLYKALSYLSDSTGTIDTFTTPFGFRWFSWSATQGFSLNGAHYWIQGGNVHQDHAGWGSGITNAALYRDVKMVKDAGMNFIRGSHYPKDVCRPRLHCGDKEHHGAQYQTTSFQHVLPPWLSLD